MPENNYHGKSAERTDYPHIVKVRGVASGEPVILSTRIMVRTVVERKITCQSVGKTTL